MAGFGIVGRAAVEALEARGFGVTVIERNEDVVARQPEGPRRFLVGSACDARTLREAGLPDAAYLVLTMPDEADAVRAAEVANAIKPRCWIVARTNYVSQGLLARQNGADAVVVEEVATAEAIAKLVGDHADAAG
ncbi:hypothetical protein PSMK_14430 [Phycisphaera mikurensis NBRC 102666]|uniref:RCK N-terminal domain-containing protein n=1 Tax=Phycisphaera mikurensis (strain NBRC 102666 / KCTC 22515 / FYK2301M01) TaxID=1142394 RepID=I0IEB4_PHYMF|nr:hypothetical protein PSMK_14430 [Phycisphaera mikurensis NBRC 102666]